MTTEDALRAGVRQRALRYPPDDVAGAVHATTALAG